MFRKPLLLGVGLALGAATAAFPLLALLALGGLVAWFLFGSLPAPRR